MKTRITKALPHGRVVGSEGRPLHLRIDLEDGKLAKVTLGIEQRQGVINWQLSIAPAALSWAATQVEEAIAAAQANVNAEVNAVDAEEEAT